MRRRETAADRLSDGAARATTNCPYSATLRASACGVVGQRAIAGENRDGEPGYVHIVDCATGAEGPGMSVEVGWSKNPNAKVNWPGGPVSGIIVPDRVSPDAAGCCERAARPRAEQGADVTDSPITPGGHRGYAATWFSLALAALVIYGLAVRKHLEGSAKAMSGEQHVLPNGLTRRGRALPGAETVALGLYATVGSRSEPAQLGGLAHLVEHMVFKGAGGARHARARRGRSRMSAASSTPGPRATRRCFTAGRSPRDLPLVAELIADLVRAPHFDEDHLEREKQVILSELGESVDSPDDLVHDHLFEAAFDGPADRPPRARHRSEHCARSRAQDCCDWLEQQFVPSRLVLAASGKVDPSKCSKLAERLFGDMGLAKCRAVEPAHFTGGVRNDRRSFEQAHWCLAFRGLAGGATRAIRRSRCSCRRSAAERRRGCSRSFARSAASLIRSMPGARHSRIPGWSASAAPPSAAARPNRCSWRVKCSRDAAEGLTDAELDRARAQIEAGLLMALETPQGRADQMARSIEVFGRILSLDEMLEQIRAVDARRGARAAGAALLDGPRRRRLGRREARARGVSELTTIIAEPWADWGLIDCGNGQKLERYGPVTVVRPEPQAMWAPARERLGPRRDLRARLGRRRRRALGPASPGAARNGSWRAAA